MSDFFGGFSFWWRGWKMLLSHRRLFLVAFLPILISLTAMGAALWLVFQFLMTWSATLVQWILGAASGFWYDIIYYPLIIGGGLLVLIGIVYVVFLAHGLIAAPFYSLLAERTLSFLGKKNDQKFSFSQWLRMSLRMLKVSLIKTVLFLILGAILFVCSFIPAINLVAVLGAMMILAFDCIDYSFEAKGWGLRQRVGYMFRNRWQWIGMALGLALTLFVPGLTLLIVPGAVVGGAIILKESLSS